jgi:hypothetical protein
MYADKDKMLGLIFGCPDSTIFYIGDCPFQHIWSLEFEKRLEFISSLKGGLINELLIYHNKRCCENGCDSLLGKKVKDKILTLNKTQ